jgi:murein DD-endopeptidase MepM/ murein hydrolase activator NlpD
MRLNHAVVCPMKPCTLNGNLRNMDCAPEHRQLAADAWRTVNFRSSAAAIVILVGGLACSAPVGPEVPDFVNCSVFTNFRSSPYVLPYPAGREYRVSRTFDHYTPLNGGVGLYAIDFVMPTGTSVTAARAGVVVAVEERYSDADHADFHENWVMVRHDDGTVARYIHLTQNGALVEIGEHVLPGQAIGISGNSGASLGPHLHFDVQACGPNLPPGYNRLPCGQTQPVSFNNTAAHSCGLEAGRTYRAAALNIVSNAGRRA